MEKCTMFPYSWHIDEKEEDVTSIRVYGLNESNENICVRINNFTPFVYLELPENIPWTASKAQMICNKLDNLLGDKKPLVKRLMYKKRLYYAHINPNGKRKTFPYLFLSFSHQSDIRNMSYKIRRPINIMGVGTIILKMHEQDASPILQFTSYRDISTAGWCDFVGKKVCPDEQKTLCDHEYKVKWKNFNPNTTNTVAAPLIMGFDIEVNSTNPSAMPNVEKPGDKVFQISCCLFRHGCDEKEMEKYLLTLGEPDPNTVGDDVEIYMYETEHDLLIGYTEFIQEKNPNVIVGYNILNFDIPYMIDRAKMNYCMDSFDQQGFVKYEHSNEKTIKWSSSAYGNQTFQFLDAEGRLYVDLLPLVKRDYKMDNYKLKTISTFFLGSTKDPLSVKGIFKCYRIGIKQKKGRYTKQAKRAMGIVGKYCVQDSALVIRLFNKLQTWIGLCEMAKTCNVPIFYLYTQGQQIKVYSQLYKYCFTEDTKVSLVHGNVPIKMLEKNKDKVLSWDEKTDQIVRSNQTRFFNNGKHDCISLEFEDGRTITCTPDHLFADTNGKWIKATDIKLGSRVKIGPVLPDVSIDTSETILARILGYIVTDGHISKHINKNCAFLGTLLDADIFASDIEKLCRFKPKIKKDTGKSNCFTVGIPVKVVDMINGIDGIYCGNRTTSSKTCLPTDLVDWNKNRLREFLGGLFGGDGWSCSYNKITNSFTQIGFTQSRKEENCLHDYFQILVSCLEKFDIQSKYSIILKNNNYVGSLIIHGVQNLYTFVDKIGYRYCYNKTMRTSVAYMYYKLKDKVKKDKQVLFSRILSLKNSGLTMTTAYKKAIQNIPTAEYMPTLKSYMRYIKNGFVPRKNIVSHNFIKVSEFIELTGSNKCFTNEESYHSHLITKTQTYIPTFSLKLVEKKEELKQTVYDIEVGDTHSFMANGVVVHNCMYKNYVVEKDGYIPKDDEHYVGATVFEPEAGVYDIVLPFDFASLYPTTIIAYNIDYSTLVTDPSIPDEDCNVMEWEDHVGCLAKGTKITLGEYSMNIEDLNVYSGQLLAYDGKNGLGYFNQTNFFDQGMKECIELTFNDGTTLKCTPDHRLLVGDGKWVEATDVILYQDKVNVGYSPPVYDVSNEVLVIDEYVFRGRELIIFYKLLGLLCTDGHCNKGMTILYRGHQIDIQNITRDIEYITRDNESYSILKVNYGWGIVIKGRFGEILRDLDGMLWGTKSTQTRTLPSILKNASKGELCAFLSGLMGGGGHTFSFSQKAQSLGSIKLSWTSERKDMLEPIFKQLQKYFTKCGIQTSVYRMKNQTFIGVKSENTIDFQEKIGFSYCVHKSMRLEAGCSYLRYMEKTWEQQKYIVECVKNLKTVMPLEDAITIVTDDVKTNFPVYNKYYSNQTKSQMIDLLINRKKWDKHMFSQEHFTDPMEYMKEINALNIFDSYGVNNEEKSTPCMQKTVIYKRNIGIQQTYDLEVETSHSFVADGIVVHNCQHDKTVRKTKPKHVMCCKRYFRFLKSPRGVMPTVLQNLLDARAYTRNQIKVLKKIINDSKIDEKEEDLVNELIPNLLKRLDNITEKEKKALKTLCEVLDKRQLAYKISANSMYGAMGVTRGYLPFMPGAMATTAMGRKNIGIVAKIIPEKFGGKLIYGDTDSNYIVFPELKTAQENWDYAEHVAREVTKMFPAPIKLEFEEEIYWRFFILTKKRYMYKKCGRDGVVEEKVGKKGVLLARRDNSVFIRNIYATLIMMVFNRATRDEIINYVIDEINNLCCGFYSYKDFVITKSVGAHDGGQVVPFINEKGKKKGKMGQYTVPLLSTEEKERNRQFKLKSCNNAKDYYIKCLPAVVQLAERMRARGQRVDPGTRLEYVISTQGGHKAKQYVKVEDAEYFKQHCTVLKIDYLYYLKLMTNPFDDVLNVLYDKDDDHKFIFAKNLVLSQYKYRSKTRVKMHNELKSLLAPKLTFKN